MIYSKTDWQRCIKDAPSDYNLRLIYADWLDENEDPEGVFQRWMGFTKRTPIYLPQGILIFKEDTTTLINHTFPAKIYNSEFGLDRDLNFQYTPYFLRSIDDSLLYKVCTTYDFNNEIPLHTALIANNEELSFYVSDLEYATYTERIVSDITLPQALSQGVSSRYGIFVRCYYQKHHIACLDIDGSPKGVLELLDKNDIPYAHYESSPGRNWFILDHASTNFDTANALGDKIPGNDIHYFRIGSERRAFVFRAERRQTVPVCLKNTIKSPLVSKFVELFNAHWSSHFVTAYYNKRLQNNTISL